MTTPSGARPEPLPSLNALLAFEAAARHASFTRAARELGVTQAAISHQVRALEDDLHTALFRRSPQGISLTAEGEQWAAELGVVFNRLRDANSRLRRPRESARPTVSVSIIPSFGTRWLVPRLGRFLQAYPDLDLRISATERLVDFSVEPVDMGIRFGLGTYPGLASTKLADDALVVVAAPALALKHASWQVAHLAHETLLHDDHPDAWGSWFSSGTRPAPKRLRLTQLTDSSMLVEAALRGQGVALARMSLCADELEVGRLVPLFPRRPPLRTGLGYYVVGLRERLRSGHAAAFRDWLVNEAQHLRQLGESIR